MQAEENLLEAERLLGSIVLPAQPRSDEDRQLALAAADLHVKIAELKVRLREAEREEAAL